LIFPVLLIGLGVLFLLNTMNIVDWRVWEGIWRFWPLILIAAGLEIVVGRRSAAGSAIIAVALLLALAGGLWLWAIQPLGGQVVSSGSISQPLQGASRADVSINFALGTLRLGPLTGSGDLLSGNVARTDYETVIQDFHLSGDTADYALSSKTDWVWPFGDSRTGRTWDLSLNSTVPTALKIDTGVGDAYLNLERLSLTRLDVNAGMGNTFMTLPAHGVFAAGIHAGVGNLEVNIPRGMETKIDFNSGLGNKQIPANYQQNGTIYQSPNYSTSNDRIDLRIEGGLGNVTVREVQPEAAPLP
jgi:hypothetical protein